MPRAVYEVGQGDTVRRLLVFNQLNRAPESGPSRTLVTASSTAYGLTEGGTQATHLKLTDRGRRLVESVDPADRLEAVYEALFSNDIFAGFIEHYKDSPFPKDEVAVDWLATNYDLPTKSAQSILNVIKANINDFGLTQTVSGKTLVASRETALEEMGDIPGAGLRDALLDDAATLATALETDNGHKVPTATQAATIATGETAAAGGSVAPQIHFNIQILIPENGSPEDYDAIFKSIGTYLLGRKDEQ